MWNTLLFKRKAAFELPSFSRFPELSAHTDRQHNYYQHHHLYCWLSAQTAGIGSSRLSSSTYTSTKSIWTLRNVLMALCLRTRKQIKWIFVLTHLLFCQESISDFYWYYSGKDIMDEPGKRNFSKAMTVAKQVFNSLTEYIQVLTSLLYSVELFQTCKFPHLTVFVLFFYHRVLALVISSLWLTADCGMPWWASCTCSHTWWWSLHR